MAESGTYRPIPFNHLPQNIVFDDEFSTDCLKIWANFELLRYVCSGAH